MSGCATAALTLCRVVLATAAVAMAIGSVEPGPFAALTQAGHGRLAGRVVDAGTGRPIPGVRVRLLPVREVMDVTGRVQHVTGGAMEIRETLGDSQGAFEFADVQAGLYGLEAHHGAYLPAGLGQVRPDGPRTMVRLEAGGREQVLLRLWKPASIAGRVRDAAGEPLAGVVVVALRRAFLGGVERYQPADSLETDDQGAYRFSRLAPGQYIIPIPAGVETLPQPVADEFHALTGEALARATESLQWSGMPLLPPDAVEVAGHLLQWRGPPGRVGATATVGPAIEVPRSIFHPGSPEPEAATRLVAESGQEVSGIDFDIGEFEATTVSGTISLPDGPAGRFGLRLVPLAFDSLATDVGFESGVTASDADGRFTFVGVPPGAYVLKATAGTRVWAPDPTAPGRLLTEIDVAGGTLRAGVRPAGDPLWWAEVGVNVGHEPVRDINVVLQPGLRLHGRLEFEGDAERPTSRQMTGVSVSLVPLDRVRLGRPAPANADADGRFTTAPYPPGRYRVVVAVPSRAWRVKAILIDGRDVSRSFVTLTTDFVDVVVLLSPEVQEARLSGLIARPAGGGRTGGTRDRVPCRRRGLDYRRNEP